MKVASLVVGLVISVSTIGLYVMNKTESKEPESKTLKVLNRYISDDLDYYDPVKVKSAHQTLITDALQSRLFDYDKSNNIEYSVAIAHKIIKGKGVIFDIRKGMKTIDGQKIDANDVVFSLKRALLHDSPFTKHIKHFITNCKNISPDLENCSGIKVINDHQIEILSNINSELFIESLASTQFSIVPISSIQEDKIVDFRNTSGPYYVSGRTPEGLLTLSANRGHHQYSTKMPQTLLFVGKNNREEANKINPYEYFKEGRIDHIPTVEWMSSQNTQLLTTELGPKQVHKTYSLTAFSAKFTSKGKLLPRNQKLKIASVLRKVVHDVYSDSLLKHSYQYIEKPGFGSLPRELVKKYQAEIENAAYENYSDGIVFQIPNYLQDTFTPPIKKFFPGSTIVEPTDYNESSATRAKTTTADIVLTNDFPGLAENYVSIVLSVNSGAFPLEDSEVLGWLDEYVNLMNKEERKEKYQRLHFDALYTDPTIIPFGHFGRFAFINSDWSLHFSSFGLENPFHKIRTAK